VERHRKCWGSYTERKLAVVCSNVVVVHLHELSAQLETAGAVCIVSLSGFESGPFCWLFACLVVPQWSSTSYKHITSCISTRWQCTSKASEFTLSFSTANLFCLLRHFGHFFETFWSLRHFAFLQRSGIKICRNTIHWVHISDRIDLIFFGHSEKCSFCDRKSTDKKTAVKKIRDTYLSFLLR